MRLLTRHRRASQNDVLKLEGERERSKLMQDMLFRVLYWGEPTDQSLQMLWVYEAHTSRVSEDVAVTQGKREDQSACGELQLEGFQLRTLQD